MITVRSLSKRYAHQQLFEDVSFNINQRDRIGLVGRNGHGKSTLLKILSGQEHADDGTVVIPPDYSVRYLDQHISFSEDTPLAEACLVLKDMDEKWRAEKILAGLGFDAPKQMTAIHELSGGFQVRLKLAKLLLTDANLLMLDEPTNYLDIVAIRWLKSFLSRWPSEFILITHDQSFMDAVCNHTMGIHRGQVRKIKSSTRVYYDQIETDEQTYERQRVNEEKKIKQSEEFINKFRAKARQANLAQSRMKTLAKLQPKKRLAKIPKLSFSFTSEPSAAKQAIETQNASFAYPGMTQKLIDDLTLHVGSRDRICVIGPNGRGKTTLLKLLAGDLQPQEGSVKLHPQTKCAYYEQGRTDQLHEANTVLQEISSHQQQEDYQRAYSICGAMMFPGDDAKKNIGVLSGGERCRVLMGTLLVQSANLLLLDEPTHHLDMQACEALTTAIETFDGAAVIVTHNEGIMKKIATKLIVFSGTKITLYHGSYEQFLAEKGWEEEEQDAASQETEKTKRKDKRRERAEFIAERSKQLRPIKQAIEKLEKKIHTLEEEHTETTAKLITASENQHAQEIQTLSRRLKELDMQIEKAYQDLEKNSDEQERIEAEFSTDPTTA